MLVEGELARAQKAATNTFVTFHEAPFSAGPHGPTPEAQRYLHPLFVRHRPRPVFCGHDHLYYRATASPTLSPAAGAPLYDPENTQIAVPGGVIVKDYHAVRLTVDGPRASGVVQTPDKRVIDRFIGGAEGS